MPTRQDILPNAVKRLIALYKAKNEPEKVQQYEAELQQITGGESADDRQSPGMPR